MVPIIRPHPAITPQVRVLVKREGDLRINIRLP